MSEKWKTAIFIAGFVVALIALIEGFPSALVALEQLLWPGLSSTEIVGCLKEKSPCSRAEIDAVNGTDDVRESPWVKLMIYVVFVEKELSPSRNSPLPASMQHAWVDTSNGNNGGPIGEADKSMTISRLKALIASYKRLAATLQGRNLTVFGAARDKTIREWIRNRLDQLINLANKIEDNRLDSAIVKPARQLMVQLQ